MTWLEHFGDVYGIRSWVDEQGHSPALSSGNGMALFVRLAELDITGMDLPEWYRDVVSVNISRFHRRTEESESK